MTTVAIVDDHSVVRIGMKYVIMRLRMCRPSTSASVASTTRL